MDNLEKALSIFHNEVGTASSAFFVWKDFNNTVAADKDIYRSVNENALSWNVIAHSLQCTFFIVLGRLFDNDSDAFSVHALLRCCIKNIDQFSFEELRKRKLKSSAKPGYDWIDEYMKTTYQPKEADFLKLKGEVSKHQKIYGKIYRPIRNKVVAHKEVATIENAGELYGKTNIGEIEAFLSFLHQIDQIIFHLLYNGTLNKVGDYNFSEDEHVHNDVEALLNKLKS